jgi:hypothetical protein
MLMSASSNACVYHLFFPLVYFYILDVDANSPQGYQTDTGPEGKKKTLTNSPKIGKGKK